MAKMLGRKGVGQCPWCRCIPEGPSDCPDTSKSNRQVRFAEERQWRSEVNEEIQRFDEEREEFAYHLWLALGRR